MLNHENHDFRYAARNSLKLDMLKRGVPLSESPSNFLGYETSDNGFLNQSQS